MKFNNYFLSEYERDNLRDNFIIKVLLAICIILILTIGAMCIIRIDNVCKQQINTLNKLNEISMMTDPENTAAAPADPMALRSLGEFTITHYANDVRCCGKTDGITATGTQATVGRTIAVDPSVIPLGSEVIIDGHAYIAEDVGGAIKGRKIDIFVGSYQEAINRGKITREVKILN